MHKFDYEHLRQRLERVEPKTHLECPSCEESIDIPELLYGLHWSTHDKVLFQLERLQDQSARGQKQLINEVLGLRELTQREFVRQHNRYQNFEESHTPRVFTLTPKLGGTWSNIASTFKSEWELQLFCESPGCWHPVGEEGKYTIKRPALWLERIAPHVGRLVKIIKYTAPFVAPSIAIANPESDILFKERFKLMERLVTSLPDARASESVATNADWAIDNLRTVRALLDELDPKQTWGNLKKVLTPEGHYLWLCKEHANEFVSLR